MVGTVSRTRPPRDALSFPLPTGPAARIHPDTAAGTVRLTVADLDRAQAFYRDAVGLPAVDRVANVVSLGPSAAAPLVELVGDPDAPPRPRRGTGLFHLALLVPGRTELARSLRRIAQAGWRLTGASDHLVSEALYLTDPEGNGIEIYRDRPREEWASDGGELRMATLPLDLESVMRELPPEAGDGGMPGGTVMGHVHLQVADLVETESFYRGVLGFEVTVRGYPGALFLAAGGYHHHIGANTWNSAGAPAPPPGSRGLSRFTVVVPDQRELDQVAGRIEAAGLQAEAAEDGALVDDPSGNRVLLSASGHPTRS